MSLEFACRFREGVPRSGFRDLGIVVPTAPVVGDDGISIPAGTEGTIVSVGASGDMYVVEFAGPDGTFATVEPREIRLAENVEH